MVRNHDVGILGFIREDGEQRLVSAGPLVWSDRDGRGALIAFDLGDGDLTVAEVVRAVGTLIQRPGHFGLDARPVGRIIETYEYSGVTPGCARYPHPDHVAVNEALRRHDFGARAQLSSTCSLDPATATADRSET